jgi:hypothetical protein
LVGMKSHYINISPATVAGYRASEAKRTAEHSHQQNRTGAEPGKPPQPLMVPVPVPPFSPFVASNEALRSGGIMFRPSMVQSSGPSLSWAPTSAELPAQQQMSVTPGTVTQLPIRVGMSGGGLPPAGGFFPQQGMPSQQSPAATYVTSSYQPTGFAPSHMQWPPSVFEQVQPQQQLQNPSPLTWSHQAQQQPQTLSSQPPPTTIMQSPQFHGMGGGDGVPLYQNAMVAPNPNSNSNLSPQQPPPMFVFLPSFPGQNPPPPPAQ